MDIEKITQALIYLHAGSGGIALLSGLVALIARKGKTIHKRSGKVFYYSMLLSAISALVISVAPNHKSLFLFAIGIFSSYFIITGYRALRFKHANPALRIDKMISWIMVFVGLAMILYPLLLTGSLNIVLSAFGIVAVIFSSNDLRNFKDPGKLRKAWLRLHLSKMIAGYIAATTAFVVVNQIIPGIYGWLTPGLIGGMFIAYQSRKLSK